MPGFDGTGPAGAGPFTGGGRGYCAVNLDDTNPRPAGGYTAKPLGRFAPMPTGAPGWRTPAAASGYAGGFGMHSRPAFFRGGRRPMFDGGRGLGPAFGGPRGRRAAVRGSRGRGFALRGSRGRGQWF
jgi:hypothetical protein